MASLCREAALGPIRAITDIQNINADDVSVEYVTFFYISIRFELSVMGKSLKNVKSLSF